MRQSREVKAESHRAIVAKASKMFRERGIAQTSVADVMQAARMTHGGFYKHFASKDDMLAAAITLAFDEIIAKIASGGQSSMSVIDAYVSMYLSDDHIEHPGLGCPAPSLGTEASRLGGVAGDASASGIARVIDALEAQMPGPKATARARAEQTLATLVGAVVIARAAGKTDVGREVLEACRSKFEPRMGRRRTRSRLSERKAGAA